MIYAIENDKLQVKICSLGATINSFIHKDTKLDVVLGFEKEEDYLKYPGPYLGATVARCANRIDRGQFEINGVKYQAPINNGPNSLHGGQGVSFKEFTLKEKTATKLVFERALLDLEDGYPGNLKLTVIYELNDDSLLLTYKGISDKDTVFNVTNHAYFNLNQDDSTIMNEYLTLYADKVALNDENGMATREVIDVLKTPFDFTEEKLIGENIKLGHPNLSNGGIDHNYVIEEIGEKKIAMLKGEKLNLTMYTDVPDFQVYTANYFDNEPGKYNTVHVQYKGVAIEPQFYPNALNYDGLLKPIIKANQEVTHFIKYTLKEN